MINYRLQCMHTSSEERNAFETYATQLFAAVNKHKQHDSIEIETVFPRWTPNVVISIAKKQRNEEKLIFCGQPTIEPIDADSYLFVPSVENELSGGIEVFNVTDFPNMGESVQYSPVKAYTALLNDKVGRKYHLFPSLSPSHRTKFVEQLSKAYANLIRTSEDLVPNYILKSIRNSDIDPQSAGANAFRPVIKQLIQKAWDIEQRIVQKQLLSYYFGSEQFKDIYQRFKYLYEQEDSYVKHMKTVTSVDITVDRTTESANNHTRISLYGQNVFDTFCEKFQKIESPETIVDYLLTLDPTQCEIIQKSEITEDELGVLEHSTCYDGFKLNVKREHKVDLSTYKKELLGFFQDDKQHTYRCKKRYSFDCDGFMLDLTMIRRGSDKHSVLRPTPFIALQKMRRENNIMYEFEIECNDIRTHSGQQLLTLMDECSLAMRKLPVYFGKQIEHGTYPHTLDLPESRNILRKYNHLSCHGDRKQTFDPLFVNNNCGPNVVNMNHMTYNYVKHHWDDYKLFVKTDGLRCLTFVDADTQQMYFFIQNALSCMSIALAEPCQSSYVLDGEFYTQNGCSTYFVFDVYYKDGDELLSQTLDNRMVMLADSLTLQCDHIVVKKKLALSLDQYQELYALRTLTSEQKHIKELFECYEMTGLKTNDDGFIVMHTGPIVSSVSSDDETELVKRHGSKPYIMRKDEFDKGYRNVSAMSRQQQTSYVFCMKWKPEEECTIDFQVHLSDFDVSSNDNTRKVTLCSKYTDDSELNLYTVLGALSNKRTQKNSPIAPYAMMHKNQSFQPAEQYEYELNTGVVNGVMLHCDPASGHIFTQRKELIQHNDIVEMQYDKTTQHWTPLRLRSDKTEPNRYSVALANWKNIFNPVPFPLKWAKPTGIDTHYDASILKAYYSVKKQSSGFSQLDNIHLLMKQYLILKTSQILARQDNSSKLSVYEVGCGKGTDLFHWNYVHDTIRSLSFFLGTDYDANGLVRHQDGAYYRYLQGGNTFARVQNVDQKYDYDALFVQSNARASLEDCRDNNWENTQNTLERVSDHKLHYQVLRHVLFGKTPDENALRNVLPDRFVHPTYNIISCQMAMHYFADSRSAFWKNVNMLLSRNGLFIATVPNGDFIQHKLNVSSDGKYTVKIRDARQSKIIPWYQYEQGASKNSVYFQTPKINRSEEPLFLQKNTLSVIRRYFSVVYFDTFGDFAEQNKLSIYTTAGDPFHAESIQPDTLQHAFSNKYQKHARPVNDTDEATEYSRKGHYVVILCKKDGYNAKELEQIQEQFKT